MLMSRYPEMDSLLIQLGIGMFDSQNGPFKPYYLIAVDRYPYFFIRSFFFVRSLNKQLKD